MISTIWFPGILLLLSSAALFHAIPHRRESRRLTVSSVQPEDLFCKKSVQLCEGNMRKAIYVPI